VAIRKSEDEGAQEGGGRMNCGKRDHGLGLG
jgi:hypothetical protein